MFYDNTSNVHDDLIFTITDQRQHFEVIQIFHPTGMHFSVSVGNAEGGEWYRLCRSVPEVRQAIKDIPAVAINSVPLNEVFLCVIESQLEEMLAFIRRLVRNQGYLEWLRTDT